MQAKPILWIIIPCYNEEDVLPLTAPLFLEELTVLEKREKVSNNSRILFVNDGSTDRTWEILRELSEKNNHYIGICLSRNRGHQNAVLAGLMEAKNNCDISISIDCDGQDDISAMEKMVDEYLFGAEVVYGVRSKRDSDSWFKRTTAEGFYNTMRLMGTEVVFNHADYRLISNTVLQQFADFREVNIFLRGLVPLLGYKSSIIEYERTKRVAGDSHYPLGKMIALAFDGITSLSIKPVTIITGSGIFFSIIGLLLMIWAIIVWVAGKSVAGWASTICIICLMGGIQLISLGVIGQYIGKTYLETKQRPRYIISEKTWIPVRRHWIEEDGKRELVHPSV